MSLMSSSTNSTTPPNVFLPPPGTNWLAAIAPAVNFLMIGATAGSVELVMLCALLFFSTASVRRTPIFVLNLLAIIIGITASVCNVYEEIHSLENPEVPVRPGVIVFMGTLTGIGPTLVDCMLLIRLHAAYSARRLSRLRLWILLGIPILLNIGRLINAIYFVVSMANNIHRLVKGPTGVDGGDVIVATRLPSVKIEWFMQIFDDCYSSLLFLYPLYKSGTVFSSAGSSVSKKIIALFWISVTNFVFPVLLSIGQLVTYLTLPERYEIALYIQEVNYHLTIISVVFATVWVFEGRWAADHGIMVTSHGSVSSIQFNAHATAKRTSDLVETSTWSQTHSRALVPIPESRKEQRSFGSTVSSRLSDPDLSKDNMDDAEKGKCEC